MRAKLSGLHTAYKKLADGRTRIYAYAYRGGPLLASATAWRTPEANQLLERELGSAETLQKLADLKSRTTRDAKRQSTSYVFGFVTGFLASPDFAKLAPSTQTAYRDYLERFREDFGTWRVALFDRPKAKSEIAEWRDEMADTPRAADYALSAVGRLFKWGRQRGLTSAKPTEDIPKLHSADRSDIIWSDADIAAFCKIAPKELQWAVRLAALTGLRQGDLLRLPRSAIFGRAIVLKTRKRGKVATIPLTDEAAALIEAVPKRDDALTLLANSYGRPWTSDGFRTSFMRWRDKAGVKKHFHDLRGTAVTKMVGMGLSNAELARVFGWSEARIETILALYVNANVVALDMLLRMDKQRASTNQAQTGSSGVASDVKKD